MSWQEGHFSETHEDGTPHTPDWSTVAQADVDDRFEPLFDVWCFDCGRSGSFFLSAEVVQWA